MIDAARCMEPVNAIFEHDRDRAQVLVVRVVLHDPDVAFGWAWLYARLLGRRVAEVEGGPSWLSDIVQDAAAVIGAAFVDDLPGAHLVWAQADDQRRAELVYALAEILAFDMRLEAVS